VELASQLTIFGYGLCLRISVTNKIKWLVRRKIHAFSLQYP